jgi:hypothetical protein
MLKFLFFLLIFTLETTQIPERNAVLSCSTICFLGFQIAKSQQLKMDGNGAALAQIVVLLVQHTI